MEDVVGADGALAWPSLRKLNIMRTWVWNGWNKTTDKLVELDRQGGLQLYYDWRFTSTAYQQHFGDGLMKADGGMLYVTYDDFGARHDGAYDDYFAMANAHDFANRYQAAHPEAKVEVRATPGETYHVFAPYSTDWYPIETDVDWRDATIVVHDEEIENKPARFSPLFLFHNTGSTDSRQVSAYTDRITLSNPAWTVGTDTKLLATELAGELAELNGKGYSRYYVTVRNANKKQYVRFGGNANGGSGATAPTVGKEGMTVALRSCRFSRSGYAFSGWAASAGGRVAYGARAFVKLKGDMDLYAVWKRVVPVRPVYALRAAKSGNWIYVTSSQKAVSLARGKWALKGVAFYTPALGGKKVYVLRNAKTGARRYTWSASKAAALKVKGWKCSTAPFRSAKSGVAVHLMYDKKAKTYQLAKGATGAAKLKKQGWKPKGIAFRCV